MGETAGPDPEAALRKHGPDRGLQPKPPLDQLVVVASRGRGPPYPRDTARLRPSSPAAPKTFSETSRGRSAKGTRASVWGAFRSNKGGRQDRQLSRARGTGWCRRAGHRGLDSGFPAGTNPGLDSFPPANRRSSDVGAKRAERISAPERDLLEQWGRRRGPVLEDPVLPNPDAGDDDAARPSEFRRSSPLSWRSSDRRG